MLDCRLVAAADLVPLDSRVSCQGAVKKLLVECDRL